MLLITTVVRFIIEINQANDHKYVLFMLEWSLAPIDALANMIAAAQITRGIWKPKFSLHKDSNNTTLKTGSIHYSK